ncbi:Alpha/Beta hydrolase fold [Phytophthora cactorum]|nr:Alpha/Beta hydrolase fold [Phytophthora cactorum]
MSSAEVLSDSYITLTPTAASDSQRSAHSAPPATYWPANGRRPQSAKLDGDHEGERAEARGRHRRDSSRTETDRSSEIGNDDTVSTDGDDVSTSSRVIPDSDEDDEDDEDEEEDKGNDVIPTYVCELHDPKLVLVAPDANAPCMCDTYYKSVKRYGEFFRELAATANNQYRQSTVASETLMRSRGVLSYYTDTIYMLDKREFRPLHGLKLCNVYGFGRRKLFEIVRVSRKQWSVRHVNYGEIYTLSLKKYAGGVHHMVAVKRMVPDVQKGGLRQENVCFVKKSKSQGYRCLLNSEVISQSKVTTSISIQKPKSPPGDPNFHYMTMSEVSGPHVRQFAAARSSQYNIFSRDRVEYEFTTLYKRYKFGVTVWSPLAFGTLTGKYTAMSRRLSLHDGADQEEHVRRETFTKNVWEAEKLKSIAEKLGCSLAQMSLAWCLSNEHVATVLVGASTTSQLEENLKALAFVDKITPEVEAEIDDIVQDVRPSPGHPHEAPSMHVVSRGFALELVTDEDVCSGLSSRSNSPRRDECAAAHVPRRTRPGGALRLRQDVQGKLETAGVKDIEFHSYPDMEHGACMEELDDVTKWLQRVIPETQK